MKKILIYNSGGGLGDAIQLFTLILSIKKSFFNSKLFYLGSHDNHFEARASTLADELGANVAPSVEQLIASSDAVVIASPDDMHAEQALLCLDAQRPTLCEKPLAPTVADATSVVNAEIDLGRRLISLGFMRRFDPGYVALKESIPSIGQPLIVHNVHRNEAAPYGLSTAMTMTRF